MIIKEKLKQKVINLLIFSLCHLKNKTNEPKTVERPAKLEITNGMKKDINSPTISYVLKSFLEFSLRMFFYIIFYAH